MESFSISALIASKTKLNIDVDFLLLANLTCIKTKMRKKQLQCIKTMSQLN